MKGIKKILLEIGFTEEIRTTGGNEEEPVSELSSLFLLFPNFNDCTL